MKHRVQDGRKNQAIVLCQYHWTFCFSVDIVGFLIFVFYKVVQQHNRCGIHATE